MTIHLFPDGESVPEDSGLHDMLMSIALCQSPNPYRWAHMCSKKDMDTVFNPLNKKCEFCGKEPI